MTRWSDPPVVSLGCRQALARRGAISALASIAGALLAAAAAAAVALTVAGYLLTVQPVAAGADALIVLGGFAVPRAELGAQLFAEGRAPLVIVSGTGDSDAMRDTLVQRGVPAGVILVEPQSRTTEENASFVAKILRERNVRSATLVTHWFHARRALASFRAEAPGISFRAASVEPADVALWRLGWTSEPEATLLEIAKIGWYAVRFGIVVKPEPERGSAT